MGIFDTFVDRNHCKCMPVYKDVQVKIFDSGMRTIHIGENIRLYAKETFDGNRLTSTCSIFCDYDEDKNYVHIKNWKFIGIFNKPIKNENIFDCQGNWVKSKKSKVKK